MQISMEDKSMKLISLVFCLFTSQVYAANTTVTAVQGTATAIAQSKETVLKVGAKVANGATVKTAANSMIVLAYVDGTHLKVKENTELVIHAEDSAAKSSNWVDLIRGALYSSVAKQQQGHQFQIKTQTAVAGVRGTEFFTAIGEHDAFWLCVEDGAVDVTPEGSEKVISVPKGLGVLIEKGKAPSPPKAYAWTKKLNWNMDPKDGDIVDHTSIENEYIDLLKNKYD